MFPLFLLALAVAGILISNRNARPRRAVLEIVEAHDVVNARGQAVTGNVGRLRLRFQPARNAGER